MSRYLGAHVEAIDGLNRGSANWKARTPLESRMSMFLALNARTVEFIAKPDKIRELRDCLRGPVVAFLDQQTGFSGALLLASHKEPRLILVLSLWQTEDQAADSRWEHASAVRRCVSSFVDVCSRVHTYEVALPERPQTATPGVEMRIC